jgi:hypothetical protein
MPERTISCKSLVFLQPPIKGATLKEAAAPY